MNREKEILISRRDLSERDQRLGPLIMDLESSYILDELIFEIKERTHERVHVLLPTNFQKVLLRLGGVLARRTKSDIIIPEVLAIRRREIR